MLDTNWKVMQLYDMKWLVPLIEVQITDISSQEDPLIINQNAQI